MITLEQAKGLSYGDILHGDTKNRKGECHRWRVNGKPKVWVRRPERVRVPLKHGLYSYDALTENQLEFVHLESECEK